MQQSRTRDCKRYETPYGQDIFLMTTAKPEIATQPSHHHTLNDTASNTPFPSPSAKQSTNPPSLPPRSSSPNLGPPPIRLSFHRHLSLSQSSSLPPFHPSTHLPPLGQDRTRHDDESLPPRSPSLPHGNPRDSFTQRPPYGRRHDATKKRAD